MQITEILQNEIMGVFQAHRSRYLSHFMHLILIICISLEEGKNMLKGSSVSIPK